MPHMSQVEGKCKIQHLENDKEQIHNEKTEQQCESPEWKEAERSLVRKLDTTLLPMAWLMYLFNYLDRNNIACG